MQDRSDNARNDARSRAKLSMQRTVDALSQAAARTSSASEKLLVEGARQLLRARLEMARIAPGGLLRDSAWDMMLELFISGQEGGILYVKQLMLASGESSTAAMRRIDRLEEAGFLERFPDPLDRRRVIVRLNERGNAAMLAMLEHVFEPDETAVSQHTDKQDKPPPPAAGQHWAK